MAELLVGQTAIATLAPYLQAAEGSGIPWWVWFILVSVLLLLLLIGFARQSAPGEPLPKPEERTIAPAPAVEEENQQEALEPESEPESEQEVEKEAVEQEARATTPEAKEESGQTEASPAAADDLKRIEGVGPKIATVLNDNGIATYAALAETEPARLKEVLDQAGINLADPSTWPEQAKLAAAGQWAELEAMQDNLKGGRKE